MNIFTSRVQYVEFSVSNYQLTTRQIPLPPELVDVADDVLKKRITSRIRAPFDGIGKIEIKFESDGKSETIKVDDQWLKKERKRIEDDYTFQINNFGRVILYSDRAAFDEATSRFQTIIERYQAALRDNSASRRRSLRNASPQSLSRSGMRNLQRTSNGGISRQRPRTSGLNFRNSRMRSSKEQLRSTSQK